MFIPTPRRIAMVCNAPADPFSLKERIKEFPVLIAVDGGANHCFEAGLHPDLLIGDLDSISPEALEAFKQIPRKTYFKDKDKTDLELAIEAIYCPEIEKISVFKALGGRIDHTLGNIILLSRYPEILFLESELETLFVIQKGIEFATKSGQMISLIPLNGPVLGIHTSGLKWPLIHGRLDKNFIGISNEALGSSVRIAIETGDLLCSILS